ncbi:indolepyruvate ferredoxin oxidoreductase, beta subunit [Methanobacterium lacus]|uniref:Indolepyruvate ferredoxin oxidoreductase subunit beta n=1 Tax=Methanobacterium lacus (strain AL-21) TaxID=877455 RepID=F0TAG6_METLA|nr:indolepyruvate oxidoreductase subunit beta [Methanobacterium lacus]ADZ08918.1 indolepyruvate ferredoxin oxidoreductase, beta subunit [Methanobacterium lacus]
MKSYSIYISGVGGQGIIKTSTVMGEAAMKTGLPVVMSEVHGMAQRGGSVSTELKIGDNYSPIIELGSADLLISFEPVEALRAVPKISKGSYIILNTNPIYPFNLNETGVSYPDMEDVLTELNGKAKQVYALDADTIARESGHSLSMNMVMLGAASAVEGFPIEKETIIDSMKANLPEKSLEINLKAFNAGFSFVKSG